VELKSAQGETNTGETGYECYTYHIVKTLISTC